MLCSATCCSSSAIPGPYWPSQTSFCKEARSSVLPGRSGSYSPESLSYSIHPMATCARSSSGEAGYRGRISSLSEWQLLPMAGTCHSHEAIKTKALSPTGSRESGSHYTLMLPVAWTMPSRPRTCPSPTVPGSQHNASNKCSVSCDLACALSILSLASNRSLCAFREGPHLYTVTQPSPSISQCLLLEASFGDP